MPRIDLIVDAINSTLNEHLFKDERFSVAKLYGISETVIKYKDSESGAVEHACPSIIDPNGDSYEIFPDSDIPVMVYHRLDGSVIRKAAKQHGREASNLERLSVLKLIFVGFRDKIKVTRDQIDLAIVGVFPTSLSNDSLQKLALKNCSINVLSSNHRSDEIYQREWPNSDKPLDPSIMIFEVTYQIGCTFDKSCINPICC